MAPLYNTLKIKHGKCPPDCTLCEEACVEARKGRGITALHIPAVNFYGAMTCNQCSEPECQAVCPVGAIDKSQGDGVVRINQDKCIGCGLCTLACPYDSIYYNPETHKSFKCDMCDGKPKCVEACPYDVLSYIKNSPIEGYLQEKDLLVPGTTLCLGCPAELALRFTLRVFGRNTIVFTAPGCIATTLMGLNTKVGTYIACSSTLLTNVASVMGGVRRYYQHIGREVNLVAFVGDGATADVGFQSLSGAAERGENIVYICYDNEGYMNTGIQRSGTTPLRAWTTTSPVGKIAQGKEQPGKNMPLIMLWHGVPYVATASIAYLEDYARKLKKAMQVKDGMAYIHLYSPCPTGWRTPQDSAIQISRLAVETNYFPLWEAENGKIHITQEVTNPRPISELTKLMGKFSHLNEEELEEFQQLVNANVTTSKKLAWLADDDQPQ